MNVAELDAIVARIAATFPSGPKQTIWREALADRDHAHCHTAYLRLRDEHTSASLTVAAFLAVYADIHGEALADRRRLVHCEHCAGTGWVTGPELEYGEPPHVRICRTATACRYCDQGRQTARIQAGIDADRAKRRATAP